jgi:hypothetical protein
MTATGQAARCTTWLLTEPSMSLANPPPPREPTATRSESPDALISSTAGAQEKDDLMAPQIAVEGFRT